MIHRGVRYILCLVAAGHAKGKESGQWQGRDDIFVAWPGKDFAKEMIGKPSEGGERSLRKEHSRQGCSRC